MTSKFKLPRLLPKIGTPPGYKNYLDVLLDQKLQDLSLQSTEFEKRAEAQQAEVYMFHPFIARVSRGFIA